MTALAAATLLIWLYLLLARGGFWRASEREDVDPPPPPTRAPSVVAVIPARNEAETIGQTVASLLSQDDRALRRVIVVDDVSEDGTAEVAREAARAAGAAERLTVVRGSDPPPGWTGKVWAMKRGVAEATESERPDFLLLTDADIRHDPGSLSRLVARAEAGGLALASVMVKLRCDSLAERALIPAFVYFFQMLYPFAWVNRPERRIAAGAGGVMLVRAQALDRAGGLDAIRGALIDDCALARALKRQGPIWLGLTDRVTSLRPYETVGSIRRMIVRSAYEELHRSPLRLAVAVAGLAATFLAPPLLALFAGGLASLLALAAFGLMILSYRPILRLYGLPPLWGLALPAVAGAYGAFTIESAIESLRGRGGAWKGRAQAAGGAG